MKNLIFIIAFMLIGSITFASENSINTIKETVKVEKFLKVNISQKLNSIQVKKNDEQAKVIFDCIHVSLSCGVQYDVCNFTGTFQQLLNSVLNSNNNVCGTEFEMIN
jgi:hypothetical protein